MDGTIHKYTFTVEGNRFRESQWWTKFNEAEYTVSHYHSLLYPYSQSTSAVVWQEPIRAPGYGNSHLPRLLPIFSYMYMYCVKRMEIAFISGVTKFCPPPPPHTHTQFTIKLGPRMNLVPSIHLWFQCPISTCHCLSILYSASRSSSNPFHITPYRQAPFHLY